MRSCFGRGGTGYCGPALCYIKKGAFFPFYFLEHLICECALRISKRRKEHVFDQHCALSILKLRKEIEKDCNFLHSLRIFLKCFFVPYILLLLAASFIMWVRGQLWDETEEWGKKDRLGTLVAMLPSRKATTFGSL